MTRPRIIRDDGPGSGQRGGRKRLTEQSVRAMRDWFADQGPTVTVHAAAETLARSYPVSPATIAEVLRRHTWVSA